MALSDREQRLLDGIEQSFLADDPKLASSLHSRRSRTEARIASGLSLMGILISLGCIVSGLITASTVGVCVAVAAVVLLVSRSWAAIRARRRATD